MKSVKLLALAAAIAAPSLSYAQEAFVAQVGGTTASIVLPAVPSVSSINQTVRGTASDLSTRGSTLAASLSLPSVDLPSFSFESFTSGGFPLVEMASAGSVATVLSTGNSNTGAISQTGLHAASILQQGNNLSALVSQTGAANRASVYQFGSNHSAIVSQNGTGNRALVIQN